MNLQSFLPTGMLAEDALVLMAAICAIAAVNAAADPAREAGRFAP